MAVYSAEHHQQAFELYYETRSFNRVSHQLQLNYSVVSRWADKDFPCKYGCPFHGWKDLIVERERTAQARISLLAQEGSISIEPTPADSSKPGQSLVKPAVRFEQIFRADIERLAHWEYLYGKIFFDLTGIALDYDHIRFKDDKTTIEELYRKGLKMTGGESALRCLAVVEGHITTIRQRLGLLQTHDADPTPAWSDGPLVAQESGELEDRHIVLDELREMRRLLQHTPTEQVQGMIIQLRSQQHAEAS